MLLSSPAMMPGRIFVFGGNKFMSYSYIETQRLILRSFAETDAQAACHNSKQPVVAHFMSDMVLQTEDEARKWIAWLETKCNMQQPCQVLAIERKSDHALLGLMGVAPKKEIAGEIEILFSVADGFQNNGYATEAGKAIIWWTFEKAGRDMLSAIVKPENKASRRVIEKLGFIYCDTRTLPYDGSECAFDYFRLYHTDYLPGPEWDAESLYAPEQMPRFFDKRVKGYNEHMLSDGGIEDYQKLGSFILNTDDALKILDVGCGTGIELDYIWEHAPHAHIICMDLSRSMLEMLIKNHVDSRDKITVIEASYLDWDYPADTFDLVVSSATMHHLWPEEKANVYRLMKRTLKSGGIYIESDFIVDIPHAEQYRRRYDMITSRLPTKARAGEYHIDIPLTVSTQKKLLLEAGFRTAEVLYEDIKPRGSTAILKARK